ncbi:MAG: glucose-6-phosphate isomerase, partial [Alphaproteobacteria bacterium]
AGFARERIFAIPSSIGGRYSLTSAMGLPVALAVGWSPFAAMLAGAHAIDRHFATAPMEANLPVRMGLSDFWMKAIRGTMSEVVVPYADDLDLFVDHLQQLDLESNGKRVLARDGAPLETASAVPLWGRRGTNSQHAFFQMLHQGTSNNLVTFIGVRAGWSPHPGHDRLLLANLLGQASALALGRDETAARKELAARGLDAGEIERLAPHLVSPGGQPSRILLLDRLDPDRFGRLMALFEHRTFVEGVAFGINPFDQWGVEYGKRLAGAAADLLAGGETTAGGISAGLDPAARALLDRLAAKEREKAG